jgi:hypothetical protein
MEENFGLNSLLLLDLSRELASKNGAAPYRASSPVKSKSNSKPWSRKQVELK